MPHRKIEDTKLIAEITDGKLTMKDSGEAKLYVSLPENKPLSGIETHLELRIVTEDVEIQLQLDASQMDRLADTIYYAQK